MQIGVVTENGGTGGISIASQIALDSSGNQVSPTPWLVDPFVIDSATGTIRKNIALGAWWLNYEMHLTYKLGLTVTGGDTADITININNVNEAPSITPATRSVFVGAGDGAPVKTGPIVAIDPDDGDTAQLTWSIVGSAGSPPFSINNNGEMFVCGILDTEFKQTASAPPGQYQVQVTADDNHGKTDTKTITINIEDTRSLSGVTIRVRGKSDKSTTATAEYILQGGSGGGPGLVSGVVEEAADTLLKNANGGDVVLLTTGDGSDLWSDLWTRSLSVTPRANSIIALDFDYDGGLAAARSSSGGADDPEVTMFIDNSEAIFFQGGNQAEYLAVWRGTAVRTAVQAKVGNVTIGGTSAGMHILSSTIYESPLGGTAAGSNSAVETPNGPGMVLGSSFLTIPIFSNTVFDTHFWQRNRMGRTLAFLARMELATGVKGRAIAADEDTALIVTTAGIARVVATPGSNRNVYIFDASAAIYGSTPPLPSVIYSGIIVQKLSASTGNQFNLATWQPIGGSGYKYWVDVDHYQSWFVRGRNWLTDAIESRYGGSTPLSPDKDDWDASR